MKLRDNACYNIYRPLILSKGLKPTLNKHCIFEDSKAGLSYRSELVSGRKVRTP